MMRRRHRRLCGLSLPAGIVLAWLLPSRALAQSDSDLTAGVDRAIASAERSLGAADWSAAEGHYREALFEGWLLLGTLERLDSRLPEAGEALRTASAFAPESLPALRALASAQLQLGEAAQAVEMLTRLADEDPRDVETRRLLARALAMDARPEAAVKRLDEALASAPEDPELVFLLATEYLWLKEVPKAERLFADVVKARPIPQTRVLIGRAYRDAGEYERARRELRAALRQDPGVRRAHYYLGMVALADANTTEPLETAKAELREELKLAPQDPLTNDRLGLALLDAARPAEALPFLEIAGRSEARSLFVYHLGRCQLALERPADAVASLRRALELAEEEGAGDAELEQVHYQLGQALRRAGAPAEASRHLAEAGRLATQRRERAAGGLQERPEPRTVASSGDEAATLRMTLPRRQELKRGVSGSLARAYFNLGVLQAQSRSPEQPAERYARAAALFEKAAELDPEFPEVQSSMGVAYFNARQFDKSIAPLTHALAAHPQDTNLKRMLAAAYVNTHGWAEAARLLQEDPDRATDPKLEFAYALALLRDSRPAEAERVLGGLVERRGDSAELSLLLAEAQLAQEKHDPALLSFQRAVRLNPAAEEAHAALASLLIAQGRPSEGVEHLETAVRLAPANPQLHEQLGRAYQGLGRTAEAEQQFAVARTLLARQQEPRP